MREIIQEAKKEEDYYTCSRCKINSNTEDRMCPCPRGGCEAKISGTLYTTTIVELDKTLSSEQKKWNKENHR